MDAEAQRGAEKRASVFSAFLFGIRARLGGDTVYSMGRFRLWAALGMAVLTPVGFASRRVNDSLGGVFYEIFWCLAAAFAVPRWPAAGIAGAVLVATCGIEFLQLWHPPVLEWARSTFVGRTILGNFFSWDDIPYYFVGSAAGYWWLRFLRER